MGIAFAVLLAWPIAAHAGTYIAVAKLQDLSNIRNNLSGNYRLTRDIDASGVNFVPIGSTSSPFTGNFDGNGFTIYNLTISSTAEDLGLFAAISGGTVSNVRLINAQVSALPAACGDSCSIGALVGWNFGQVVNVSVSGGVVANRTGSSSPGKSLALGGVVGDNIGDIRLARSAVRVDGQMSLGYADVGGLAGRNIGFIGGSSATGNVSLNVSNGSSMSSAGGLSGGGSGGGIVYSFAVGDVSATGTGLGIETGGLAGSINGALFNSYAMGAVSGPNMAGGLVGTSYGTVTASYATGPVTSTGRGNIGGLIGESHGPVDQAYAAGRLSSSGHMGGLIGKANSGSHVTNAYWDVNSTGVATSSGGGTGVTTEQLTGKVLPAGFDLKTWEPIQLTALATPARYYPQLWGLPPAITGFPLAALNPYTAQINSVFDHSMQDSPSSGRIGLYGCDRVVRAFAGLAGEAQYGATDGCGKQPGYHNARGAGVSFVLNGANYKGADGPTYLDYDGHPGIDYHAIDLPVYAATSGVIFYPWNVVGMRKNPNDAYCRFHALAQVPDTAPAYRIYYLHMSTHPASKAGGSGPACPTNGKTAPLTAQAGCYALGGNPINPTTLPLPEGTHVAAGCQLGVSSDAGVPGAPHLHVEVHQLMPAAAVKKDGTINLTPLQCYDENAGYTLSTKTYCVPRDPYGWLGATDCSGGPENWRLKDSDVWACLTGEPSQSLWTP